MSQLPLDGCGPQHSERRMVRAPEPRTCPLCLGKLDAGALSESWRDGQLAHPICAHATRNRSFAP